MLFCNVHSHGVFSHLYSFKAVLSHARLSISTPKLVLSQSCAFNVCRHVFAHTHTHIYIYIPAPSNRSPLEAFVDLKVAGGDLLEGPGIYNIL